MGVTSAMASGRCPCGMDPALHLSQWDPLPSWQFQRTHKGWDYWVLLLSPCLPGSPQLAAPNLHLSSLLGPACYPAAPSPRKAAIPELCLPPRVLPWHPWQQCPPPTCRWAEEMIQAGSPRAKGPADCPRSWLLRQHRELMLWGMSGCPAGHCRG